MAGFWRMFSRKPQPAMGGTARAGQVKCMNPPHDHAGCPTSSSDEVKSFRRFPRPGLPPLGRTHLAPEQRFAKHKGGHKAGKYVFRYGLVPVMYDHINPVESRERAEVGDHTMTPRVDMLATWLTLHAYRGVYRSFRGYMRGKATMRELVAKATPVSMLALVKIEGELGST